MPVEIRLSRHGRRNLPYYRIVVADKRMPRDGRYLELIGRYDTRKAPALITLKEDRVKHWIGVGAQTSDTLRQIIAKQIPGFLEELAQKRLAKLRATRAKRKKANKGKTAKASPKKEASKAKKKTSKPALAKAAAKAAE